MAELLEWAAEQPLFTVNEAQRITGMARPSLREKLSRLSRRGDLRRVERGKYTVHDDPLVYGSYIERPSFLSLWSGLRYYNLTTQQPAQVQVIASTNRSDLDSIEFYQTSQMFGFGKRRYREFDIFVADEERLLLDCLERDRVPVSELRELVTNVDIETAKRYADRLGTNAVKKRLGYLVERHRGETVEALQVTDRNYPLLDLSRPATGETDPRWQLRVNADVR